VAKADLGVRRSLASLSALVGILVLLLAASGCGGVSSAAEPGPTPSPGGTYVVPLDWDPPGIEPSSVYDSASGLVNHQVFQGLVRWETGADGVMRGVPCLAESWSASADATVWTFHLRRGATFQPPVSREVTAQDVVVDWRYLADPANESAVSYLLADVKGTDATGYAAKGLSGVEALDRYTVQITLKHPFADFPLLLGNPATGIWPVDYMKKVSPEAFRNKPIGTGPYMVERWAKGKYIDLVKNPDYWDVANAGYVDRVHMPFLDQPTQWQEFQKGTLDIASVPGDEIDAARDAAKAKDGSWDARAWPTLAVIMVSINQKSPLVGGSANLFRRQALSYAVDRDAVMAIKADVWAPPANGRPATGIVPDGILHDDAGGLPYPWDPKKAKQLAQQLSPLPTFLYTSWGTVPQATHGLAVLDPPLLAGWRAAGLDVARKGYEWSTYLRKVIGGTEGDLSLTGWIADYPSPDDFLYPLFHSGDSGAGSIWTYYQDRAVDRLLEEARATLDEKKRLDLYAQVEKTVLADAPVIPLYFCGCFCVTNERVQGQTVDPMGNVDAWKVWVK
jgi:oligopeptide transport system substrate-binding protein